MKNLKVNQIIEGYKNHLFPNKDKEEIIELASSLRLEKCNNCQYHSKNHKTIRPDDHCTHCGCSLLPKTKCLSCECPLPNDKKQWHPIILKEDESN
jgi:hypothetical protein